jgi:NADH:ubiquinone oxidoreductase subunit E
MSTRINDFFENMHEIRICAGPSCANRFARDLMKTAKKIAETRGDLDVSWAPCMAHCEDGPNVLIDGVLHSHIHPEELEALLKSI